MSKIFHCLGEKKQQRLNFTFRRYSLTWNSHSMRRKFCHFKALTMCYYFSFIYYEFASMGTTFSALTFASVINYNLIKAEFSIPVRLLRNCDNLAILDNGCTIF
jgi:hypothetical protein